MNQIVYVLVERYEDDECWTKNMISSLNQEKIISRKIKEEAANEDDCRTYFIEELLLI